MGIGPRLDRLELDSMKGGDVAVAETGEQALEMVKKDDFGVMV